MRVIAATSQQCRDWGRRLGERLRPGSVVALEGELGVGKTLFVQGMAIGLAIEELPTSPTFNIVHRYGDNPLLFHIDLYRIETTAQLAGLDLESYFSAETICAIEWATRAADLLPRDHVCVSIRRVSDGTRIITIEPQL